MILNLRVVQQGQVYNTALAAAFERAVTNAKVVVPMHLRIEPSVKVTVYAPSHKAAFSHVCYYMKRGFVVTVK